MLTYKRINIFVFIFFINTTLRNEVNKSDTDKSGGYTPASVREISKSTDISHSKLEVLKSFKYINISGANDPRSVEAIIRNKKQSRMLDLNIPTTNMLTHHKQILPSKRIMLNIRYKKRVNPIRINFLNVKIYVRIQYSIILHKRK